MSVTPWVARATKSASDDDVAKLTAGGGHPAADRRPNKCVDASRTEFAAEA